MPEPEFRPREYNVLGYMDAALPGSSTDLTVAAKTGGRNMSVNTKQDPDYGLSGTIRRNYNG